jgi:D-beta-D-heptose 7-phosphate kinase/D-beta-D-heptose 1-phosphate adenosyltransferase
MMNLKRLFKEVKNKEIVVVGDLILDQYIWGVVDRISPEAPVPVVEVKKEEYSLGGAANVGANIVSLGAKVTVVGVVGEDIHGETMLKILKDRSINSEGVFIGRRPTTVKTRVIAHNQQVVRFDREDARGLSNSTFEKLKDFLWDNRDRWDGIIVSDYKKGVVSSKLMKFLVESFKKRDVFVSVDPKIGHFRLYRDVSLITPNIKEASDGAGIRIKDEKTLVNAGKRLLKRLRCDTVLITRGEEGMSLFKDEEVVHIPTFARSVYDVTGAGDTVIAVYTTSYIAGASAKEAAIVANYAAGVVVGKLGTATATPQEIIQFMEVHGV